MINWHEIERLVGTEEAALEDVDGALHEYEHLGRAAAAIREARERIVDALGTELGAGGWYVRGDLFYRWHPTYRWDIVDEDLFWRWVKTEVPADRLGRLFNADDVKVRGLRAIADETVIDSFVLRREWRATYRLESRPKQKWPRWVGDAQDGDRGVRPVGGAQ